MCSSVARLARSARKRACEQGSGAGDNSSNMVATLEKLALCTRRFAQKLQQQRVTVVLPSAPPVVSEVSKCTYAMTQELLFPRLHLRVLTLAGIFPGRIPDFRSGK